MDEETRKILEQTYWNQPINVILDCDGKDYGTTFESRIRLLSNYLLFKLYVFYTKY